MEEFMDRLTRYIFVEAGAETGLILFFLGLWVMAAGERLIGGKVPSTRPQWMWNVVCWGMAFFMAAQLLMLLHKEVILQNVFFGLFQSGETSATVAIWATMFWGTLFVWAVISQVVFPFTFGVLGNYHVKMSILAMATIVVAFPLAYDIAYYTGMSIFVPWS
jgi:hypothetical protein